MDLTCLANLAALAVGMDASPELEKQCHEFVAYIEKTKWHHEVRREAKAIAKLFKETIRRCSKQLRVSCP